MQKADAVDMEANVLAAPERPTPHVRRLRLHAVALAVAIILGLSLMAGGVAAWVMRAGDDPFENAPELRVRVYDYMVLPTLGQTYRAGDVEVVLLAIARTDEGGWSLHFVLHDVDGLERYGTRLAPSGSHVGSVTCSASGRSGWGECYVAIPATLGKQVDLELWQHGKLEGAFHLDLSDLI